jgi:hypothetical protein
MNTHHTSHQINNNKMLKQHIQEIESQKVKPTTDIFDSMTNNQTYDKVGINYNGNATSLTLTNTDPNTKAQNIVYSGSNFVNTTYRIYTNSSNWNVGAPGVFDITNNYFRGGTLI